MQGEGRDEKLDCGDSMRINFWNKRPNLDRVLTQQASNTNELAREFKYQVFKLKYINHLAKFLVLIVDTWKHLHS